MANNSLIFDGAVAGATGGIHERWITAINQNSYTDIRNLIVSFALQVDALIPIDPSITIADQALIQSICAGVLAERYPSSTDLSDLPRAIATLYQAMRGQLVPITSNALTSVRYVDRNTTVPTALQNGSILFPYTTIAQAIASLPTGGTIQIVPGDYSSEGTLNFSEHNWTLSCLDVHPNYVFGASAATQVLTGSLSGPGVTGTINLVGLQVIGTVSGFFGITADSCYFNDDLASTAFDAYDCRFLAGANITITGGMGLADCKLDATVITCPNAILCRLVDCELASSFTLTSGLTGNLFICGRTNYYLQSITNTITGATVTVTSTPGQNIRQPAGIVATGALGTIDISTIESGGVVLLEPTANYNIDGFTAKPNGFWFDLWVNSTNTSFVGTLNQEVGATATTRIRNPNNLPSQLVAGQITRIRYQFNRWRAANIMPSQALLTVATPVLAAGTTGYVNVSLVGTALAGTPANAQVYASPQADLAAAGAGAGYYINCRMSASDTLRMLFVGTLAGGNVNFLATRL